MTHIGRYVGLLGLGLVLAVSWGCGDSSSKGVIIRGKVMRGEAVLPVNRPDIGLGWVQIDLIPDGQVDKAESSRAKPDGTFEFVGVGQGIPPGKYDVAVYHYENGPPADGLQGTFAAGRTPIKLEVPADQVGSTLEIGVIDLATGAIKK